MQRTFPTPIVLHGRIFEPLCEISCVLPSTTPSPLALLHWAGLMHWADVYVEVARLLVEKGADINKARDTEDLLYACCEEGHVEVARLLVEKGADINKARDTGATPLYICCQEGHLEVARLLVDKGADVNKANDGGRTPLFTSCQNGHLNIARLLLCHRADPSVMPPSEPLSLTLASLATEEGHPQLAAWLEQCAGWSVWQHVCEARREDLLLKMLVDEELVASCPRRVELLGESVGACGWSCLELARADNKLLLGVSALPVIVA